MNTLTVFSVLLVTFFASPYATAQDKTTKPAWPVLKAAADRTALPGTKLLKWEGDFADLIVSGANAFALQKIEATRKSRKPTVEILSEILGLTRDERFSDSEIEYTDTIPGARAEAAGFRVYRVRWRAFRDVYGTGLLLEPKNGKAIANVVAIPDAAQEPEQISGLEDLPKGLSPFAYQLAASGCRVLVPSLITREDNQWHMPTREFLHRPAYILGRTLIGYELQKILAGADAIREEGIPTGIIGRGEGGRLALYAGAVEKDFSAVMVSGYFAPREKVWNEPADRTVFGLLNNFGDAEIAGLVGPQKLVLENGGYPEFVYRADENGEPQILTDKYISGKNGKPGKLIVPTVAEFASEIGRIPGGEKALGGETIAAFFQLLTKKDSLNTGQVKYVKSLPNSADDAKARQAIQVQEIDQHNQWALVDSRRTREAFLSKLNTKGDLKAYEKSTEAYRKIFSEDVIGNFSEKLLPLNPRTRKYQEGEGVVSYHVLLDTFPGVPIYGILTMPKNLPLDGSEKLPVVVCQHGLEGRPGDVIGERKYHAYIAYSTRLAQRGYITFAPQNLYILFDKFRSLQFKSNAIGKTLFSYIVPQHEQIISWLQEQPFVEGDKIGFYGLSYGGKAAMRIPALVERYSLSICSGDFNEWIWKNAGTDPRSRRYSYANRGEYEMYEFDLGNTFNYSGMAALICPRPFMVERGHFDGVGFDEMVGYEYAKVRHLYAAKLKIPELTTIEWFDGPHKINGVGSYEFLDKYLKGK